ncbi:MAG: hypothetical protein F7B17_09045 [Desulfurococcales archaeon]|nr:hypothetical protein [Desulfurococcales archaeon]
MPMRVCNYKYVRVVGGPIGFVPEEPSLLTGFACSKGSIAGNTIVGESYLQVLTELMARLIALPALRDL